MSVMDRSPGPQILFDLRKSCFPKRLPGDDAGAIDVPSTFGNTTLGSFTAAGPAPLRQTFCGLIYMPTYWSRLAEVTFHRSIFRGV